MGASGDRSTVAFAQRVLLAAGLVAGLVLLVWGLAHAVQALLLTFAGVLIAIILRTPALWLQTHTPLGEGWSLGVVITVVVIIIAAVITVSAPLVGEQARELRNALPEAFDVFRQWVSEQPWSDWLPTMGAGANGDEEFSLGSVLGTATGIAYTTLHAFLGVFILSFIALYLAINPQLYIRGLLHLVPLHQREQAALVLAAVGGTLRYWLVGTLIRMVAVGLLTFLGLWALGTPLALILATLAGLLDFVPYFGPIIAAVPAILVAFTAGPEQAFYVLLLYLVVQQIESLIISPVVYQQTVYLPPVITILGQIILFSMAGVLGGILATPLVAVVLVLVQMLYVKETLGDSAALPAEQRFGPDDVPPVPGRRGKRK